MADTVPEEYRNPKRIPLAVRQDNRLDSTDKDARVVNGFVESAPTGLYVYKRPGYERYSTHSGDGHGCFNWRGDIYSVYGETFYKGEVATGLVDATNGVYHFSSCLGAVPKLFLHNAVAAYVYDDASGLVPVTVASQISTTGDTTNASAVVTGIPSTVGLTADDGIEGAGIPDGAYIVTVDSATQVTISVAAVATGNDVDLVFTTSGFPSNAVKGAAYLDGTMYVLTNEGFLRGSNFNDPAVWDSLNAIRAQIEPDGGVFCAKQLTNVIAFKEWTTEVFYDAGNATGSPLGPVQGAKVNYGCRVAGSVQDLEGDLYWVATTRSGAISIQRMAGLKASTISTPAVERLLQNADFSETYSWGMKIAGHLFYGLTVVEANLTLVFDVLEKQWYQWTDGSGEYWKIASSTYDSEQRVLVQHLTDGRMYRMSSAVFVDDNGLFTWDLYTPNWDGETRVEKYVNQLTLIGDRTDGELKVRWNDHDYDAKGWTNFRTFDLSQSRPLLPDCGSFRRRAHHFRHRHNGPLRLKAVEMLVDLGTL